METSGGEEIMLSNREVLNNVAESVQSQDRGEAGTYLLCETLYSPQAPSYVFLIEGSSNIPQELIPLIPSSIRELIERKDLGGIENHQSILDRIEEELFDHFKGIAEVLDLDLEDVTEMPIVIDRLRAEKLIDESTWSKLLDMLLIIDGLKMQVMGGEPLSEDDLKILQETIEEISGITIPNSCPILS